jgi:hypothetical protein
VEGWECGGAGVLRRRREMKTAEVRRQLDDGAALQRSSAQFAHVDDDTHQRVVGREAA